MTKRFDYMLEDFDPLKSKLEEIASPDFYQEYKESKALPTVKTCKCCRERFIPKSPEQEFCNENCKVSYKAQIEFIQQQYSMDTKVNGCYFHNDCFTCPFEDCIL